MHNSQVEIILLDRMLLLLALSIKL